MSDLFQRIARQHQRKLPFVLYCKPGEEEMNVLFQNSNELLNILSFSESGFVMGSFEMDQVVLFRPDEKYELTIERTSSQDFPPVNFSDREEARNTHLNLVQKAIETIQSGQADKIVVSRKIDLNISVEWLPLFMRLVKFKNAFSYLAYHPEIGIWCGATPEVLLKNVPSGFETMALAGTTEFVLGKEPAWSPKEIQEQQMVTDYIEQNLKGKVKRLKIDKTESIRAGNVWHLRSKIQGDFIDSSLDEVIEALHPTPAVCGLPKKEAFDFIISSEKYDREFYTGFLGELNLGGKNNESHLFVNLRCMKLLPESVHIFVGGGITSASESEKEWKETVLKSQNMLKVLDL